MELELDQFCDEAEAALGRDWDDDAIDLTTPASAPRTVAPPDPPGLGGAVGGIGSTAQCLAMGAAPAATALLSVPAPAFRDAAAAMNSVQPGYRATSGEARADQGAMMAQYAEQRLRELTRGRARASSAQGATPSAMPPATDLAKAEHIKGQVPLLVYAGVLRVQETTRTGRRAAMGIGVLHIFF